MWIKDSIRLELVLRKTKKWVYLLWLFFQLQDRFLMTFVGTKTTYLTFLESFGRIQTYIKLLLDKMW